MKGCDARARMESVLCVIYILGEFSEIKAHWAAAEAPAPEATPCRKQILSSEKDFAAVVSVLVAEAQAHWAIDESR